MMLLFSAGVGLTLVPYPPFGLITVSFFGLTSFLVFFGIYSTAISVAHNFLPSRADSAVTNSFSRDVRLSVLVVSRVTR